MTITEFIVNRIDGEEGVGTQWMQLPLQRTPPANTPSDLSDVRDLAQLVAECDARRALLHGPAAQDSEVLCNLASVYAQHPDHDTDWNK
jgi:hypothetical protein